MSETAAGPLPGIPDDDIASRRGRGSGRPNRLGLLNMDISLFLDEENDRPAVRAHDKIDVAGLP